MRISTQTFYEQSRTGMGAQQGSLLRVQQQLAAGLKILAPSDDPLGATRALAISQSIALTAQYSASRKQAAQTLSLEENALQSVTVLLQKVKSSVIEAGNGTMSDADRATIATSLQGDLDQLQGLANTDDGNGQFLFAGFRSNSAPFVRLAGGSIGYLGDQGQRQVQVDASRQMAGTDDGRSIFLSVQSGAGYVASAPGTNTGSGVFGATSVVDPSDVNYGKDFAISFPVAGSYQVDTVPASAGPVVAATPFAPGSTIAFGGLQISISGTPAAGDVIHVATAQNAGPDVFATIGDVIKTLRTPADGPANQALVRNALSTANRKLTHAHDNVLTVRASIGSRLQELDALAVVADDRTLIDKSTLSDLQDLDYASAIAEFYQRQTALQASQQTFVKIQQIALFNYL